MALITLIGAGNIVLGVVSIVFYSIIVGIKVPMYNTGCGLWTGALLIVAGLFAIWAGRSKHRMSYSFTLLTGVVALIADIAAIALAVYVFYYLTNIYPDSRVNMPIYQVYMAFHVLWFLTVVVAFFMVLVLLKTARSSMPEARNKGEYVDAHGEAQADPNLHAGGYREPPRPYYY